MIISANGWRGCYRKRIPNKDFQCGFFRQKGSTHLEYWCNKTFKISLKILNIYISFFTEGLFEKLVIHLRIEKFVHISIWKHWLSWLIINRNDWIVLSILKHTRYLTMMSLWNTYYTYFSKYSESWSHFGLMLQELWKDFILKKLIYRLSICNIFYIHLFNIKLTFLF